MMRQLLKDALKLDEGLKLHPHKRDCGSYWVHPETTDTYRLVNDDGHILAVIDAWCLDGDCFGYVRYDASGQHFVERNVFRLTPEQGRALQAASQMPIPNGLNGDQRER